MGCYPFSWISKWLFQAKEKSNLSYKYDIKTSFFYLKAIEIFKETKNTEISYYEMMFNIRYNTAEKLLYEMEKNGIFDQY